VSDPIDIKALDGYLKGNSDVSQRYRELGPDEVPPELDRHVLAAAREAVTAENAKPARSWLRWSAPVALAASIVLVLTVFLESGVHKDAALVLQAPEPPGFVPVVPVPAPPARHADIPPGPEPEVADVKRFHESVPVPRVKLEQEATRTNAVAAPAPAAAAPTQPVEEQVAVMAKSAERKELARDAAQADASSEVQSSAYSSNRARRQTTGRVGAGARNSVSAGALAGESRPVSDDQAERADPEGWLEDIRILRRDGKSEEADREWLHFRAAFPDFHVADDDIARKKP
jgi:hypothetical protein